MIIDFHTHTFPAKISVSVMEKLGEASKSHYFTDGSVEQLLPSMQEAGIRYCINLPVMTGARQVEKINSSMIDRYEALLSQGIITFGGMHPDYENYRDELRRLKAAGIKGIKLHPAYQNCDIDDPRMLRIIDAASELDLVVLTHAGLDIGILEKNYADVEGILHVIQEMQPPKFVLAHMGGWDGWEEVERDLAGAPVWFDTAFSVGPITPRAQCSTPPCSLHNLHEADFVRLVRKHGTDKVLFATDSPWASQKEYVEWFKNCGLTEVEQAKIFYQNAAKLLQLDR